MFDCGDGTVRQMVQTRLKASKTRNVFITHLHSDHFFGLPSVGLEMKTVSGKRAHLFAPRGIRQRMSTVEQLFNVNELRHVEQLVYEDSFCTIHAVPIKHSIPTFGYIFEETSSKGRFSKQFLEKNNLSRQNFIDLRKTGKTIFNGKELLEKDCTEEGRRGRKIGDTCDPSAVLKRGMNADVLVHEATHINANRELAIEKGHSTAGMAGNFAKRLNCSTLLLNHFSTRIEQRAKFIMDSSFSIEKVLLEAKAEFDGRIIPAMFLNSNKPLLMEIVGKLRSKSRTYTDGGFFLCCFDVISHGIKSVHILLCDLDSCETLEIQQVYKITNLNRAKLEISQKNEKTIRRILRSTENTTVVAESDLYEVEDCSAFFPKNIKWKTINYKGQISKCLSKEFGLYIVDEEILLFLCSWNSAVSGEIQCYNVHAWNQTDTEYKMALTACCYSNVLGTKPVDFWYSRLPPNHQLFLFECYETLKSSIKDLVTTEMLIDGPRSILANIYVIATGGGAMQLENHLDYLEHDEKCRMMEFVEIHYKTVTAADLEIKGKQHNSLSQPKCDMILVGQMVGNQNGNLELRDSTGGIQIVVKGDPEPFWINSIWMVTRFILVVEFGIAYLVVDPFYMYCLVKHKPKLDGEFMRLYIDCVYPVTNGTFQVIGHTETSSAILELHDFTYKPALKIGNTFKFYNLQVRKCMDTQDGNYQFVHGDEQLIVTSSSHKLKGVPKLLWSISEVLKGQKGNFTAGAHDLITVYGTVKCKSFSQKFQDESEVLVVRLEESINAIDLYVDLAFQSFPLGLLEESDESEPICIIVRGAVRKVSAMNNVYLWATSCSKIEITESLNVQPIAVPRVKIAESNIFYSSYRIQIRSILEYSIIATCWHCNSIFVEGKCLLGHTNAKYKTCLKLLVCDSSAEACIVIYDKNICSKLLFGNENYLMEELDLNGKFILDRKQPEYKTLMHRLEGEWIVFGRKWHLKKKFTSRNISIDSVSFSTLVHDPFNLKIDRIERVNPRKEILALLSA